MYTEEYILHMYQLMKPETLLEVTLLVSALSAFINIALSLVTRTNLRQWPFIELAPRILTRRLMWAASLNILTITLLVASLLTGAV